MIGLAAYEGSKQKDELIDNIHFLCTRRLYCKSKCYGIHQPCENNVANQSSVYHREAEALVDFSGQLKAVLTLMGMPNQDSLKPAIDALTSGFVKDVQTVWTNYGAAKAYEDLAFQDKARGSFLEKDKQLADIEAEMAKDPNAPVPTPQAKPGSSVTTMLMSDGYIKIPASALNDSRTTPILHHHAKFVHHHAKHEA